MSVLAALLGRGLLLALLQFDLVEPRAQHLPGLGAVLVLRALALAHHHDAGRDVREPHRRFGLVDVLAAGAAGAHGVGAHVGLVDLDLDASSITGKTATLANEVWRRALESNGEMRTRRCTPSSVLSQP